MANEDYVRIKRSDLLALKSRLKDTDKQKNGFRDNYFFLLNVLSRDDSVSITELKEKVADLIAVFDEDKG